LVNFFFILPRKEIISKSEFSPPTIIKLIIILFKIIGVFEVYNINFIIN
jgi:hypothetical protein